MSHSPDTPPENRSELVFCQTPDGRIMVDVANPMKEA
jgi:hypothetical protein